MSKNRVKREREKSAALGMDVSETRLEQIQKRFLTRTPTVQHHQNDDHPSNLLVIVTWKMDGSNSRSPSISPTKVGLMKPKSHKSYTSKTASDRQRRKEDQEAFKAETERIKAKLKADKLSERATGNGNGNDKRSRGGPSRERSIESSDAETDNKEEITRKERKAGGWKIAKERNEIKTNGKGKAKGKGREVDAIGEAPVLPTTYKGKGKEKAVERDVDEREEEEGAMAMPTSSARGRKGRDRKPSTPESDFSSDHDIKKSNLNCIYSKEGPKRASSKASTSELPPPPVLTSNAPTSNPILGLPPKQPSTSKLPHQLSVAPQDAPASVSTSNLPAQPPNNLSTSTRANPNPGNKFKLKVKPKKPNVRAPKVRPARATRSQTATEEAAAVSSSPEVPKAITTHGLKRNATGIGVGYERTRESRNDVGGAEKPIVGVSNGSKASKKIATKPQAGIGVLGSTSNRDRSEEKDRDGTSGKKRGRDESVGKRNGKEKEREKLDEVGEVESGRPESRNVKRKLEEASNFNLGISSNPLKYFPARMLPPQTKGQKSSSKNSSTNARPQPQPQANLQEAHSESIVWDSMPGEIEDEVEGESQGQEFVAEKGPQNQDRNQEVSFDSQSQEERGNENSMDPLDLLPSEFHKAGRKDSNEGRGSRGGRLGNEVQDRGDKGGRRVEALKGNGKNKEKERKARSNFSKAPLAQVTLPELPSKETGKRSRSHLAKASSSIAPQHAGQTLKPVSKPYKSLSLQPSSPPVPVQVFEHQRNLPEEEEEEPPSPTPGSSSNRNRNLEKQDCNKPAESGSKAQERNQDYALPFADQDDVEELRFTKIYPLTPDSTINDESASISENLPPSSGFLLWTNPRTPTLQPFKLTKRHFTFEPAVSLPSRDEIVAQTRLQDSRASGRQRTINWLDSSDRMDEENKRPWREVGEERVKENEQDRKIEALKKELGWKVKEFEFRSGEEWRGKGAE